MPVFHPKAYQAALNISGRQLPLPPDRDFDDWNKIFSALEKLTPEERCDALYADWVMQLSSPGGDAQLQIRSLLLERGALAANYLAELAQNADDAADGEDASLTIKYEKPWLTVANNGRKVTSRNLLGLCRFFVHWGQDPENRIDTLNEETIGKFGIGFKSCYSVAKEVYVTSWDEGGEFAFRLPIATKGDAESLPIVTKWEKIKQACSDSGLVVNITLEDSGYCTPEYLDVSSTNELKRKDDLCPWPRGTMFRFHLHTKGQERLEERIKDGPNRLYELCPLFLPSLKDITFGENKLKISETRSLTRDNADLPIKAQRVTLNISADEKDSNDRFWRITGNNSDSKWSLAISADSDFKVRVSQTSDNGLHVKQGGAYAFFPLNSVNAYWSALIHLHIDLPTNLARSEWNENESDVINQQIKEAATYFAEWLSRSPDRLHEQFDVQGLFPQIPTRNQKWLHTFYDYFRSSIENLPLFKAFSGERVSARDARAIRLYKNTTIRNAADRLESISQNQSHCVLVWDDTDWNLTKASQPEITNLFNEMLEGAENNQSRHLDIAYLLFATEDASPSIIENISKRIEVSRKDGRAITLADLLKSVGGAKLAEGWHTLFRFFFNNLSGPKLAQAIFNKQLRGRLRDLQNQEDVFEWEQLSGRLSTENDWNNEGEAFWSQPKPPCPAPNRDAAIQALHTKDVNGKWEPITKKWLLDTNVCQCFVGHLSRWKCGLNQSEREQIINKLKGWDLWDTYNEALEERIKILSEHLLSKLQTDIGATIELLNSDPFSRSTTRLSKEQPAISALVNAQIRSAIQQFLSKKLSSADNSALRYFKSNFSDHEITILEWLGYQPAWKWLSPEALKIYSSFSISTNNITVLGSPLSQEKRQELAKEILIKAWQLDSPNSPSIQSLIGVNDWFTSATGNWEVATAANRRDHLRGLLAAPAEGDPTEELTNDNGKKEVSDIKRLPNKLAAIPELHSACIHFSNCKVRVQNKETSQPIVESQIEASIKARARVQNFFNLYPDAEIRFLRPLNFDVAHQQREVYKISDASFAIEGSTLYVSKAAVGGSTDYEDKLAIYLNYKNDAEIRTLRENGQSAREIYLNYRDRFIAVFRKELVEDVGYKKQHILKELLQNAESAYASSSRTLETPKSFTVTSQMVRTGKHRIQVDHNGRGFNELDNDGNSRDDIRRIVSLGNQERDQNEEEIGRFNRGFKSLFHATDYVMIRSARYQFGIRDLIFLEPSDPTPDNADQETTSFSFECSTRDLGILFGKTDALSVFSSEFFIFSRHIETVLLKTQESERHWNIARTHPGDSWSEVRITDSAEATSCFRVKHFTMTFTNKKVRVATAIRIDQNGNPLRIERNQNKLALTFPTEDKGFGNFYLSGDFTADPGRIGIRLNKLSASMLAQALEELLVECKIAIEAGDAQTWLSWVNVISPLELRDEIQQRLPDEGLTPISTINRFIDLFMEHIPFDNQFKPARLLIFPSKVLRDFADQTRDFIATFNHQEWAPAIYHEALKKHVSSNLHETTLPAWIDSHLSTSDFHRVTPYLQRMALDSNAAIQTEVRAALHRVAPNQIALDEPSDLDDLLEWWASNNDTDPYTITGTWWKFIRPTGSEDDMLKEKMRAIKFKSWLEAPNSEAGALVWFRFLSIAALLSAGRQTNELFKFMTSNPLFDPIWSSRSQSELDQAMDHAFTGIVERHGNTELGRGEYAYIWRRVFYDLRKIFRVVHEFGFGESILELCNLDASAVDLVRFMKGGVVNGDPQPWIGVLGQTASSTLLFLLRELQRINLLSSEHASHCYFMCRPVRRCAVEFGILDNSAINETDLFRLMDLSKELHEAINENHAVRDELNGAYDIPFLAYGLNVL